MKNSLAVKSLAAGLGAVLAAGPAAAQVVGASAARAATGLSAAAAAVSAPQASLGASLGASLAPAVVSPAAPALAAPSAPMAAPAAAPALAAAPAASAPAPLTPAGAPAAAPAERIAGPTAIGRLLSRLGLTSKTPSANEDFAGAKAQLDARFDGVVARATLSELPAASANDGARPAGPALAASPSRFSKGVTPELQAAVTEKAELIKRLQAEIGKVIVGQREMVDSIVMAMIASEHVFLEGVPGVAKTQAVKAASDAVSGDFKRIQGTPDKLPSDIIGAEILADDPQNPGVKLIKVQFGPVFTNILLVDEINRMMPKTQSALLEAMAEGQVTIGNQTYKLSKPFIVLATQNPIEQEGTFRLPEAQQDRFMLKVSVPLPSTAELVEIMERFSSKDNQPKAEKVHSLAELDELRKLSDKVYVDPALKSYIANLVDATSHPDKYGVAVPAGAIEKDGGAGPRAAIYLLKAARVHALMDGRAWAGPADVAAVAHRILRHRIILGFSAPRDLTTDKVVDAILERVAVPAR